MELFLVTKSWVSLSSISLKLSPPLLDFTGSAVCDAYASLRVINIKLAVCLAPSRLVRESSAWRPVTLGLVRRRRNLLCLLGSQDLRGLMRERE